MSEARAIKTDGIGTKTTAHLNFDVVLGPPEPKNQYTPPLMVARLRNHKGNWLHKDLTRFTILTQDAWAGSRKDRDELYRAHPEFRSLAVIPI